MSLLLDALRRAAATKQGPQADSYTVPRRSEGERDRRAEAGRGDTDADGELVLEPELPEADDSSAGPEHPAERPGEPAPVADASARRATAGTLVGGRRPRPSHRRPLARALLGLVAVLAAAAAVAAGGWWYYLESQRASRADLAAYQPTAEPLVEGDSVGATATGAATAEPARAAAPAAADPGQGADRSEPAAQDAPTADAAATAATEPAAAEPAGGSTSDSGAGDSGTAPETAAAGAGEAAASASTASAATRGASAPDEGAAKASAEPARRAQPLVRATGPSELARTLQDGYAALRAGDVAAAARAYGRALELAPNHRDALLGAASVAQRRGDPARAAALYRRVLSDHPRDEYARAALAGLQGASEPRRSETELKRLLRARPGSAALHFALGNLYAAESRWAEAQSAYFEAHRAEPQQGDYAYNLAVALDHLGKRDAARDFYRKAIAAGATTGAQFPVAAARRRLEQLQ